MAVPRRYFDHGKSVKLQPRRRLAKKKGGKRGVPGSLAKMRRLWTRSGLRYARNLISSWTSPCEKGAAPPGDRQSVAAAPSAACGICGAATKGRRLPFPYGGRDAAGRTRGDISFPLDKRLVSISTPPPSPHGRPPTGNRRAPRENALRLLPKVSASRVRDLAVAAKSIASSFGSGAGACPAGCRAPRSVRRPAPPACGTPSRRRPCRRRGPGATARRRAAALGVRVEPRLVRAAVEQLLHAARASFARGRAGCRSAPRRPPLTAFSRFRQSCTGRAARVLVLSSSRSRDDGADDASPFKRRVFGPRTRRSPAPLGLLEVVVQ